MSTGGSFVRRVVEFAASVEGAEQKFQNTDFFFLVFSYGDATPSVSDNVFAFRDVNDSLDVGISSCQRFVDGVIDDFFQHTANHFIATLAHIHAGACTNSAQSFKDFDA